MFVKRLALATFLALLMGSLTACGMHSQTLYEQAQWYLGTGEYAAARGIFSELGGFEESDRYALYCAALEALAAGETDRARADFTNLEGFLQSDLYLSYLDARDLEAAGQLDEAREEYRALGSFSDSQEKAQRLDKLIPQRDQAAARTYMALGDYEKAYEAFLALGEYEDSPQQAAACQAKLFDAAMGPVKAAMGGGDHQRALTLLEAIDFPLTELMQGQVNQLQETCRAALYARAAQKETEGMEQAREAIALYESLGAYQDSAQRAQALSQKYSRGLALGQGSYVRLGQYQGEELMWRVLKVYEGRALLLTDRIVEARPLCQEGETFTTYEQCSLKEWLEGDFKEAALKTVSEEAVEGPFLLSGEEAQLLPHNPDRQALATAHAEKQGLRLSSQKTGWWWLSDQGELNGCQSIVYFSGAVYAKGVQAHDAQTGVRPALWLDLEAYPLREGAGSAEDPYR